jgi:hypothetical protein
MIVPYLHAEVYKVHNKFPHISSSGWCCFVLFGWQEWMEQAYLGGTGVDIPAV